MRFPLTKATTLETQENPQEEAVHENKIKTINNIQVNLEIFWNCASLVSVSDDVALLTDLCNNFRD